VKSLLKWLLAIVGIVAVLLVVATVVLPMVIDPNNYKDEIAAAVKDETGRDLRIGGDIEWSVFPTIGLKLSAVQLGNPKGFGEQPMFDIGEAGVSVRFLPLLQHRLEVGEVKLNDVAINLSRRADGKNNWDDLGGAGKGGTTPAPAGDTGISSFTISGIEINNARVSFDDAGQTTELKAFDLKASNIELGRPFDLQGGFSVILPGSQLAGDVTFSGLARSAADGQQYGIDGFRLAFKGEKGPAGDTLKLDVNMTADADIDLSKDQAVLKDFALKLDDLTVSGDLTVTSLTAGPKFAGQLNVAEFNPKSLMKSLGLETPVTSNDKALTRLGADMKFSGTADSADMQNLVVAFDDSAFKGHLRVSHFSNPNLAFDFQVDHINLDDYLPPENTAAGAPAAGAPTAAPAVAESDLSVETFRGFTGGGDFRVGKLVLAGLTATNVSTKMSSDGKSVRFDPVNADFYGGTHKGDITIDASGERPIMIANLGLSAVQAEALLTDLTGSARLSGKGDFYLRMRTDLTNSQTVLQDLSGNIGMNIHDGEIIGIDVLDTIATVKSLLGKQSEMVSEASEGQTTEFAELTMNGVIDNGIVSSDDLLLKSPLMTATGKGTFNLVDETVDYVLKPVVSGEMAGVNIGNLKGVPIPVRLTGNLYEPDIKVDIVAALAESQKERINKKAGQLINQFLGGDENAEDANRESGSEEKSDPGNALLEGILGVKKNPDKDKDGDGGAD